MKDITRNYIKVHDSDIRCPKCKSEDVVVKEDEGYFWVYKCNSCGYSKNIKEKSEEV